MNVRKVQLKEVENIKQTRNQKQNSVDIFLELQSNMRRTVPMIDRA